jgi:tetratricopeptide (TPR) repeat protein
LSIFLGNVLGGKIIHTQRGLLLWLFFLLVLFIPAPVPTLANDLPPDREAAILESTLTANPEDGAGWIRLGDLQRVMGYTHDARESFERAAEVIKKLPNEEKRELAGAYYTARAWLEYDATDWEAAVQFGGKAIKYDNNHETRLVTMLALSGAPNAGGDDNPSMRSLLPIDDSGPSNRRRNYYWIILMRHHMRRIEWSEIEFSHTGGFLPKYNWAELFCRRDYGYAFESKGLWKRAGQFYEFSVERSEVGRGNWATHHLRPTPLQSQTDPPMPFWTNADGGYVTGSLMAYTAFASEQMLHSGHHGERQRWARHVADGASRCLAVYPTQPWPWLWRAIAWQVLDEQQRAVADLQQAAAEFAEVDLDDPAYTYAKGHELILKENYGGALPWLERAASELPDLAVCWTDLGVARVMSGDRGGALAAFDQALEHAPDWAAALHNRGVMYLQDGRFDEALTDLTRAAEMAPEDQQIVVDFQRAKLAAK